MKSFIVTSDANLNIDFEHVTENPLINGIEIVAVATEGYLLASPASLISAGGGGVPRHPAR